MANPSITEQFKETALDVAASSVAGAVALTAAAGLKAVFNEADPVLSASLRERQLDEFNGKISGSVQGLRLDGKALNEYNLKQQRARAQGGEKKSSFVDFLLLLTAQIEALEAQIDALNDQIDATQDLIDIMKSGEEIDPTDPDHQRLLKAAGIPEDEWGTVTMADLEDRLEVLKAERDEKQAQVSIIAEKREKVEEAIRIQNKDPSTLTPEDKSNLENYEELLVEVDVKNIESREALEQWFTTLEQKLDLQYGVDAPEYKEYMAAEIKDLSAEDKARLLTMSDSKILKEIVEEKGFGEEAPPNAALAFLNQGM